MKTTAAHFSTSLSPEPAHELISDYAYHLYQQSNCAPGHDVENWLEATACLKANIPADCSRNRLHYHVNSIADGAAGGASA